MDLHIDGEGQERPPTCEGVVRSVVLSTLRRMGEEMQAPGRVVHVSEDDGSATLAFNERDEEAERELSERQRKAMAGLGVKVRFLCDPDGLLLRVDIVRAPDFKGPSPEPRDPEEVDEEWVRQMVNTAREHPW